MCEGVVCEGMVCAHGVRVVCACEVCMECVWWGGEGVEILHGVGGTQSPLNLTLLTQPHTLHSHSGMAVGGPSLDWHCISEAPSSPPTTPTLTFACV